jgi:hypothetical protein
VIAGVVLLIWIRPGDPSAAWSSQSTEPARQKIAFHGQLANLLQKFGLPLSCRHVAVVVFLAFEDALDILDELPLPLVDLL